MPSPEKEGLARAVEAMVDFLAPPDMNDEETRQVTREETEGALARALSTGQLVERERLLSDEALGAVASDIAIHIGDDLLRRAGLESAPNRLWAGTRQREEAAWLSGRDDTLVFVADELEGCIRTALELALDTATQSKGARPMTTATPTPERLKELDEQIVEGTQTPLRSSCPNPGHHRPDPQPEREGRLEAALREIQGYATFEGWSAITGGDAINVCEDIAEIARTALQENPDHE